MDALKREQGSYRLGEISSWASIPRATCDRYLKRMAAWGLVEISVESYNGLPCRFFSITTEGKEFKQVMQI
jgi:DNA-binding IclR family transcriptional regulator